MSTLSDITLNKTSWTDVHKTKGLVGGEAISVQNKTDGAILLYVGSEAPSDDSGIIISGKDLSIIEITPMPSEFLFAKSITPTGRIGVQK